MSVGLFDKVVEIVGGSGCLLHCFLGNKWVMFGRWTVGYGNFGRGMFGREMFGGVMCEFGCARLERGTLAHTVFAVAGFGNSHSSCSDFGQNNYTAVTGCYLN